MLPLSLFYSDVAKVTVSCIPPWRVVLHIGIIVTPICKTTIPRKGYYNYYFRFSCYSCIFVNLKQINCGAMYTHSLINH